MQGQCGHITGRWQLGECSFEGRRDGAGTCAVFMAWTCWLLLPMFSLSLSTCTVCFFRLHIYAPLHPQITPFAAKDSQSQFLVRITETGGRCRACLSSTAIPLEWGPIISQWHSRTSFLLGSLTPCSTHHHLASCSSLDHHLKLKIRSGHSPYHTPSMAFHPMNRKTPASYLHCLHFNLTPHHSLPTPNCSSTCPAASRLHQP